MYHSLLINPRFHALFVVIDDELAEQARKGGCSCGGPLHQANYPRSSLGLPLDCREHEAANKVSEKQKSGVVLTLLRNPSGIGH